MPNLRKNIRFQIHEQSERIRAYDLDKSNLASMRTSERHILQRPEPGQTDTLYPRLPTG